MNVTKSKGVLPRLFGKGVSLYVGKTERDFLYEYRMDFPGTLKTELFNFICYKLRLRRSYRYLTINIEPTNCCNLTCLECPVPKTMNRKRGTMEFSLFKKIIDENPQIGQINLALWGEPLLHPDAIRMMEYAKSNKKHVLLITNGALLDEEKCRAVVDSGLDMMYISMDGIDETYTKVRGIQYHTVAENLHTLNRLRNDKNKKMPIVLSVTIFEETEQEIEKVRREWGSIVDHVVFQPLIRSDRKRTRRCRQPWRQLAILWNGDVIPCCYDYDGKLVVGNVREETLLEIFNGKRLQQLRANHAQQHFPDPCDYCNEFFG